MTGFAAVVCGNDICQLGFGHLAFADLEEGAYDCTNHIPQEAIGGDDKGIFRFGLLDPLCLLDIADGGLDIRVYAAERRKVLFAEQETSGFVHCFEIESGSNACMVDIEEGIFSGCDSIVVRTFDCIEASVCIVLNGLQIDDGNRVG